MKSGLYHKKGNLLKNFTDVLSDSQFAVKATKAFKDNYLLDFINTENLGETGADIDERIIAGEEMFIDLLFFNRELNCTTPAFFFFLTYILEKISCASCITYFPTIPYLTILDGKVKKDHENPSVGLILCKDMNKAFVDYVIRDYEKPLRVATYKTYKDMSDDMNKALPNHVF